LNILSDGNISRLDGAKMNVDVNVIYNLNIYPDKKSQKCDHVLSIRIKLQSSSYLK
jgi:hypothetical protein